MRLCTDTAADAARAHTVFTNQQINFRVLLIFTIFADTAADAARAHTVFTNQQINFRVLLIFTIFAFVKHLTFF